jgi:hypothetical protein
LPVLDSGGDGWIIGVSNFRLTRQMLSVRADVNDLWLDFVESRVDPNLPSGVRAPSNLQPGEKRHAGNDRDADGAQRDGLPSPELRAGLRTFVLLVVLLIGLFVVMLQHESLCVVL